ncbi:MAG: hypothetical protein EBR98_03970, partial [Chitinophagaceae bacterium]|nr:hypothetical protein [Chitinophagaceae bacterium]
EPVNVIREDPTNPSILYVGTDGGVYVSWDGGLNYKGWHAGLPKSVPVHDIAIQQRENEIVFLHEDDYLYKSCSLDTDDQKLNHSLVIEGLEKADYVTLYDHPDKYIPPSQGGNPKISDTGVEFTGVFLTANSHWKYTNSTTLTFAAFSKTLKEDLSLWAPHISGPHPYDFQAFLSLGKKGRNVASTIPGRSTHCDPHNLSPLTNWDDI